MCLRAVAVRRSSTYTIIQYPDMIVGDSLTYHMGVTMTANAPMTEVRP
jgi:hypothetical protein